MKLLSARDEDESSSDSDTSSKLSESETTDLSDDSNTNDDLDNIIVDKAVIEVPADRSEKSSDDDSEKEKERILECDNGCAEVESSFMVEIRLVE